MARIVQKRGKSVPLHTHDFSELFWIERGRLRHTINGEQQHLDPGEVVLIRPSDVHRLHATGREPSIMVNLAFERSMPAFIRERYFTNDPDWPGAGGDLPAQWRLTPLQLETLSERINDLDMHRQSRLDLEHFMLGFFQLVRDDVLPSVQVGPLWLKQALYRYRNQQQLTGGPATLAAMAGYSLEHLNRVIRHHYNMTTTKLINQIRLERAAHQLRMTSLPIAQIALDCGFSNLGYFYNCFSQQFDATPRQYRLAGQRLVQ